MGMYYGHHTGVLVAWGSSVALGVGHSIGVSSGAVHVAAMATAQSAASSCPVAVVVVLELPLLRTLPLRT